MAIGMGLLKDREMLIDSARLLSIVVRQIVDYQPLWIMMKLKCRLQ